MTNQEINATVQTQVIQSLTQNLRAGYVFPEIAEKICERLQKHLKNGDYVDIAEGEFFAYALTQHIQAVSHDEHLWVRWHPDPLPDHDGSLLQNEERLDEFLQIAKLDNHGIHKAERLPGNIGYVDIRYFCRPSWGSGDTAVAAMNFVANTYALIFDLRKCGGGNPGMVALISSYLFEGEPLHLNNLYWRDEDFTQQYWTLPYVPGKRCAHQPVYVLTSKDTFSAGEEFSYNLKTRQRATLVGEATGGGAHPGSPFRLHPHFEVFIPLGRAINPITNDNWERVGVVPDISVSSEDALEVAYKLALDTVMEKISASASPHLRRVIEEAKKALEELKNISYEEISKSPSPDTK